MNRGLPGTYFRRNCAHPPAARLTGPLTEGWKESRAPQGCPAFGMPCAGAGIGLREEGGVPNLYILFRPASPAKEADGPLRRPARTRSIHDGWRWEVTRALELPPEVLLDVPRLLWVGGRELTIENHRGLLEYNPRQIRIRVGHGEVVVEGARLEIQWMSGAEIVLTGHVHSVHMNAVPMNPIPERSDKKV